MPDGGATLARRICMEPVKWPRPRTMFMMSVAVFVLGVLRVCLLPDVKRIERAKAAAAEAFPDLELIRLVQAEELAGIRELMESEERDMEAFKKNQERASLEWANLAEMLSGYAAELEEIGNLAQTVAQDYAGDVDLSTEAVQAQANLENFQRSVMESMEMFNVQLDQQEATLRKVNKEYSEVGEQATADAYKEVETKVADALKELELFRSVTESNLSELETEINGLLTAEYLEELLNEKAVLDRPTSSSSLQLSSEDLYRLVEAEIDRLVGQGLVRPSAGGGGSAGNRSRVGDERGCISSERLLEEVQGALDVFAADGTGLRDYANKAIGGVVLKHDYALTSPTFTRSKSWIPSEVMHRLGLENGIGPVDSLISQVSSPGHCWVMEGNSGRVSLKLPKRVFVDGVSLEHASRMLLHESSSAPRDFEVYGLRQNVPAVKLGNGSYDIEGPPIQTISFDRPSDIPFMFIQFVFLRNYGNPDYTCIYRVRVHGRDA